MITTSTARTLAFLTFGAATLLGQQLPTTQPKLLTIYREQIKTGHDAAHLKTEAGWPAAFAKAKSPDYYLALASLTGPSEVWFIVPWESYGAWGESMERDQANEKLSAELDRVAAADAEHVDGLRVIEAVASPALSHGSFPNLTKTRFWEITVMRVRPGHESEFAAAAKAYQAAAGRAAPSANWRIYRIGAGMVSPTYLIFSSVEAFGQFDAKMAEGEAMLAAMTPEERELLRTFAAEGLISSESNRYRLDPRMSYVSEETKATDPDFWSKKR